ncbi:MAG: restriction endonuclease subunit S [Chloroflexi bacterium]|nr:MAG: restriction endonuclease subunit S [Chloroflexota bacterium]
MIDYLKPYPEYKDSGLLWLEKVPAHWAIKPGFAAYRQKRQKNTGMIEKRVLSLSYGRIVIKPDDKLHGLVPESFETYQVVDPGDIIIRSTDLQNDWNSLRVGLVRDRGIITSAYLCLDMTGLLSAEYGYQQLHALDLMKVFYGMGSGLRQNLDFSDLKRMPVLIPPPDEQAAIVRFLDHANRRIDRYIRAKRKLITLLNEQKQAIIHQAVTRGLDPNVRFKPTGVEWLGEVPEHWEVKRCRYIFREVDERSIDGMEEHLSMSQKLGLVPSHLVENKTLISESYAGGKLCRAGDLVLNRLKAHLGVFALSQYAGVISPDYTVLRPIDPAGIEYFERVLRSPACRGELRTRAKGIVEGFWRLYTDDFYDIRLPVPPPKERVAIIDSIRIATAKIENSVSNAEREIDLLREYHTRLVADVVTGQLDVRAAASLPAIAGEEVERMEDWLAEDDEMTESEALTEAETDAE